MSNILLKLFGLKAAFFHGDPTVYDRWKWLSRHLESGPKRTLDAGCGNGAFALFAASRGNECVGLSHDDRNRKIAENRALLLGLRGASFRCADLRELDKLSNRLKTFDQIICLETIEHLKNDRKLLRDLSALLAPGGKLLLTTPYKHYKHLLGDKLSEIEDGGHVRWGYTHEEIEALLNDVNIKPVSQEYISGFFSQQLTNLMRFIGGINERIGWLVALPLRVFQSVDSTFTNLVHYPYLSIGVVGVKMPEGGPFHPPKMGQS